MDEINIESSIALMSFIVFAIGVIVGVIVTKFSSMIHYKGEAKPK